MSTMGNQLVPFSVNGKTAIVTGAGSGINLIFAQLLVSRGCNVVLADLALRPEAEAFLKECEKSTMATRAIFLKTDVRSWKELSDMFSTTLSQFGDFDIVCPGAGVYEPKWSSFWHPPGSPESRDAADGNHYALLDINITHPIRATQLAISHWLHPQTPANKSYPRPRAVSRDNPKRVVHISSVAAQLPVFRAPLYGASKHAISGFIRCLAPLGVQGINVTGVAPGVVKTPLWTDHPEKLLNVDESKDAWVTPMEVAQAMLRCVEAEEAGTVLEVGRGVVRLVSAFNDPGPSMDPSDGFIASNSAKGDKIVWECLRDGHVWGTLT